MIIKAHEAREQTSAMSTTCGLWQSGLRRYGQFCLVGGSGVAVDMGVLWVLASPAMLGWNLSLSKVLAAEVAILNNFLWNELWTFRELSAVRKDRRARFRRLGRFNLICLAGIGWSVLLLNLLAYAWGMNVYAANLVAIVIVSLWNYFMNLRFGWGHDEVAGGREDDSPRYTPAKSDVRMGRHSFMKQESLETTRVLHMLSGMVLLVFASSHFAYLLLAQEVWRETNPVFNVVSNGVVFLIAGLNEMCIGLICLRLRGRGLTNVFIFAFISQMLLYRWALSILSAHNCGCAGILGRVAHLSKGQEQMAATAALVLMSASIAPWAYNVLKNLVRRSLLLKTVIASLLVLGPQSHGAQTIEIFGVYDGARYNARNSRHERNNEPAVQADFCAILQGDSWYLCSTNRGDQAISELWYDGTNTFTRNRVKFGVRASDTNGILVSISPSQFYLALGEDRLYISLPWLTYGLSPRLAGIHDYGSLPIPVPWLVPRNSPLAFGFRWNVNASPNARFVESCLLVRDSSLDLTETAEFLRPEFEYPHTLENLQRYRGRLAVRRSITNGFVEARYDCTDWHQIGGLQVPAHSELVCYYPDGIMSTNPWFEGKLSASSIRLLAKPALDIPPTDTNVVFDFRYRRTNVTKIFREARYVLNSGDSWRAANDPLLLSEAEQYLKHGPKMGFGETRRRILVCCVLGLVVFGPGLVILIKKRTKTQ